MDHLDSFLLTAANAVPNIGNMAILLRKVCNVAVLDSGLDWISQKSACCEE